jgi:hypothetical protein
MAHTKVTKQHSQNTGVANTFSYSGSFDVFKGSEVVVSLDAVNLTFTSSTINESASPREYTVDTTAKTIHIGGADLSSGTIIIRPVTDLGAPTPRATYTPGASITSADLNNNQTQLLRKALEYDADKLSSTGGTMTGHLEMGEDTTIIFEGATANAHEITLTVANPSSDTTITLPNTTGTVVTTGDTGTVATAMIAGDAVNGDKIADDSINSEHYVADSIDAEHYAPGSVDTNALADNSVTSAKILDGEVVNADLNAAAAIAHSKLAAIPDAQILVGSGSTVPTAVAVSGDVTIANTGAVTIANDAVEIGMIGCEQTTITDSDSHLPTSGAVVDYVAAQLEPFGGFEVIANRTSFPNTVPASGVVISILDANGVVFDSTSTPDTTTGNCTEVDGTNVTIQAAPDALQGKTIGAGVGLLCSYSGSGTNYTFHRLLAKDDDVEQLSQDINDFKARYRVASSAPGSNNDAGDLYYDTNNDKMYVRNSANNAWGEVTSTGEFKFLFLCPNGGSGAPTINGSIATYDLREGSNSGTGASVTTAAQLIVSVNGVVQKPNTGTSAPAEGFAMVDSNTIIFGSNLPTGAVVFVIQVGSAVSIPTPGDNTVTSAKIVDGAIMNADINASADIAGSKIADDSITEAKLDIHAAPSGTDKFLKYTSNGMEWVVDNNTNLLAGGTATGHINLDNDQEIRLMEADSNGSAYVGIKGATDKGAEGSYTLSLPAAAPTAGKALVANASTPTNLEWGTAGGAAGGGTDQVFYENEPTITTNYTIAGNASTAMNAMSAGPITINNGVTVTIGATQTWTIV